MLQQLTRAVAVLILASLTGMICAKPLASQNVKSDSRPSETPEEKFDLELMASGFAEDGTMLSINTYHGTLGHDLTIVHGKFSSPDSAIAHLHRKAKTAEKTFSLQTRKEVAGERAVVLFSATKSVRQQAAVLLTEGPDYYEVLSPSLQVVLDFEEHANRKRFKP